MALPTRNLNPASQQWGGAVERRQSENEQALVRSTQNLQHTDKVLQDGITRLNKIISAAEEQQDFLLGLTTHYVESPTDEIQLPAVTYVPSDGLSEEAWTTEGGLRPALTVNSPSGRIKITIAAYGHNGYVTYSIPGVMDRSDRDGNGSNQFFRQILLPGGPLDETGVLPATAQREWVQEVPPGEDVTVTVECAGLRANAFAASPSLTVQIIP